MERITNVEMLRRLDMLLSDLIQIRDKVNVAIAEIKLFKTTKSTRSDSLKVEVISKCTLDYFNLTLVQMKKKTRKGDPIKARQIFCTMAKEMTDLTLEYIGGLVNQDHSTVLHSCNVLSNARDTKDELFDHYLEIQGNVLEILEDVK